ncbi:glucosamine inositolphosphorylceramide transferase family protein [Porticoccus sp.]
MSFALLNKLLDKLFYHDQWEIGVSSSSLENIFKTGEIPDVSWWVEGKKFGHFRADPFFLGSRVVFERLNRWTGRGQICIADLDGSNEGVYFRTNSHLSYPSITEIAGRTYFIPEMSDRGICTIFEVSTDGPPRAIAEINQPIVDPTLICRDGMYWILGSLRGGETNALYLWHSTSLVDGWAPHRDNPVKIDSSASRPAGNLFTLNGQLIRPAQDSRIGYGSALALCRIERLDPSGYREQVVQRIFPADENYSSGIHTINVARDLIVVDGKKRVFSWFAAFFKVRNKICGYKNS